MLLQEGKLREADAALKKMEDIDDDSEVFVLRAIYAESMHDTEKMRDMLGRALALEPGNVEALSLKKKFLE